MKSIRNLSLTIKDLADLDASKFSGRAAVSAIDFQSLKSLDLSGVQLLISLHKTLKSDFHTAGAFSDPAHIKLLKDAGFIGRSRPNDDEAADEEFWRSVM